MGSALLVWSCVSNDAPTGPGGLGLVKSLALRVSPVPSAADASALPINRIRAVAEQVSNGDTLGMTVEPVSPDSASWKIQLEISVSGVSAQVVVSLELIHVDGQGVETVQYSGRTGPITVAMGSTSNADSVEVVRGPLDNLLVTGVKISGAPDSLVEGATATLSAEVSTSSEATPTVYWTSLDSTVASMSDSTVHALAPGVGRIVASAGAHADTVSIRVTARRVQVDLALQKTVNPDTANAGDTITFTMVLSNAGPDTATSVTLQDTLPSGLVSAGLTLPAGVTSLGGGLLRADTLLPSRADTMHWKAVVSAGAVGMTLSNVIRVVSVDQVDPDTTNNVASALVSMTGAVDLGVIETSTPANPRETDTLTFTVRVYNSGSVSATSVVARDSLLAPFTFLSDTATLGSYAPASGLWTIDTLVAGDTAQLVIRTLVADGSGGTTGTNTASIASMAQTDLNPSNDSMVVSVPIQKRALNVSVSKTVDKPLPVPGDKLRYTVQVTNQGPSSATNLILADTMPSGLTVDSARWTAGTVVGDQWTIPTLAQGQTATMTGYTTVNAGTGGTVLTNRARLVSLSQSDTVPLDDVDSVAVTVALSTPPVVTITSPADSTVFNPGDTIQFSGTATDAEDGNLTSSIQWTSSRNGNIGTGGSFSTFTLSPGPHTIVAKVTDSSGTTAADTIHIILAIVGAPTSLNVPFGGSASLPISLSAPAPTGGLLLTVTSSDAAVADPTTSTVTIPAGGLSANATIQGLTPGTATVYVVSAGYGSDSTAVSVTAALNITQTSVTFPQTLTSDITVRLESQGTPIAAPGAGMDVTLDPRDTTCVAVTSPVTIPTGQVQTTATLSYGGSATTQCNTWVVATAASVQPDSVRVYVNPPPALTPYVGTVGSGLQSQYSVSLGAPAPAGGLSVHLASTDSSSLLLSPDATTAGTGSIDVVVPAGGTYFYYYAQGLEGQVDTVSVVASAPGYTTGSGRWSVVQPAIYISALNASTTTLSADDAFQVIIGYPYSNYASAQAVRAGGTPVTVTVAHSNPGVARLADSTGFMDTTTVTIPVGQYTSPSSPSSGGVALHPVAAGVDSVSVFAPGVISSGTATQVVTISAPNINVYGATVGSGLQAGYSVSLGAPAPTGGLTVHLQSADSAVLLVSPSSTTAGTGSIDVVVPAGSSSFTYYGQGVEGQADTASVVASAPGYTNGSGRWSVVQPAIYVSALSTSTTTLSADDAFQVIIGYPYSNYASAQPIRAGGTPVTVTVAHSSPGVARLADSTGFADTTTVTIPVGQYLSPSAPSSGGVAFHPLAVGVDTVNVSAPGVISSATATQIVTVSAPSITVYANTVGSGLQAGSNYIALGAPAPAGGVTIHLQSADSTVLLVSPDDSTPGTGSIDVTVPAGQTGQTYYAQGLEGKTGSVAVTASAPQYANGSGTWSVVQPALYISGLNTTTTTLTADNPFQVIIGTPYSNYASAQPIRAGGTPVTVTLTSSTPAVGQFTDSAGSSGLRTLTIGAGQYATPYGVPAGGIAFDALTAGTTTVSATIPGFVAQPLATQVVTVSAPALTVSGSTVGSDLQTYTSVSLGAPVPAGGMTVRLTSSAPGVLLLSPDANTAGASYIDVPLTQGQTYFYYYAQGVEGQTGTATVTATAPGFTDGSAPWTVATPYVAISGLNSSVAATSADDPFTVIVGIASGSYVSTQYVRAGGTALTATVTSSTPASGLIADSAGTAASKTVTIPIGQYSSPSTVVLGGVAFHPVAAGTSSVSASIPGFGQVATSTVLVTITP